MADHEALIACYRKILSLRPDDAQAWNSLGLVYQETGQKDEAVECFRRALSLRPDYGEAYRNLAQF